MTDVSIIIPAKGGEHLTGCIASATGQTRRPKEIIVSYEASQSWANLNTAIDQSRGDGFVVLMENDELTPRFIEKVIDSAEAHLPCMIIYTDTMLFGARHGNIESGPLTDEALSRENPIPITTFVRRIAWDRLRGFDPMAAAPDWDLWQRVSEQGYLSARCPYPLFRRRIS